MISYKNDSSLKNIVVAYLDNVIFTLESEERELIELWRKWQTEDTISEDDKKREIELLDSINSRDQQAYNQLYIIQKAFADRHGFTLTE